MAGAVVVGFIIHKMVAKFFGMPDATESFSSASGIQCMCKDKWGKTRPQSCGGKYPTCDECCSHYGKDNVNEEYGW